MRIKNILFLLMLLAPLLSSCGIYKMEIRQGNYVTPEMRTQLKTGMTRQQVRYVLGTPMISDAFHDNRWDYVYRLERDGSFVEQRNLTLYFEGEILARIVEGDQPVDPVPAKVDGQVKG